MSGVPGQSPAARRCRRAAQLALAPLLGLGAALLVACGSSAGTKLIPTANAGPLQSDFQEVAEKAETANGNCSATEKALLKTEQDFGALPSSTDNGLRERLREGITNLHQKALTACQQPSGQTTGTTGTTATTPTQTTTTPTTPTTPAQTAPPQTTSTPTQTAPVTPETGGVAPEEEKKEKDHEKPPPGGGTGPGGGDGNGVGGQEGGR